MAAHSAWWIKLDGQVDGPRSGRELKKLVTDGKVLPDTPVSPDQQQWVPARKVKGLFAEPTTSASADGHANGRPTKRDATSFDAFLSYSTPDKPTADAICATLERNKVRCWIAPRDILPGKNYAEAIIDGINSCRLLVVVLSSASNGSPQVLREVERAVNRGIPIIPFRIEDVKPTKSMEYFLSAPHWLDALTPPMESHIGQLSSVVSAVLDPAQSGQWKKTPAQPSRRKVSDRSQKAEPSVAPPEQFWSQQKLLIAASFVGLAVVVIALAFLFSQPESNDVALNPSDQRNGLVANQPEEPVKESPQTKLLAEEYSEYRKQVSAGRGSVVFIQKAAPGRYTAWRAEADAGNDVAELFVGRCYQEGIVVKRDLSAAIPWLEKSAAKGNIFAMHTLGLAYEVGQGVAVEPSKALQWYTKAADAGNPISMRAIGGLHAGTTIAKPNFELALSWYRKAATAGDPVSMRFVGDYYRDGTGGVSKDSTESEKWYTMAAAAGDSYTVGKHLGNRLAPHFADYLKENSTDTDKSNALSALRALRDQFEQIDLPGFEAIFNASGLRDATSTLGELESTDPLQVFHDSIIQKFMAQYAAASLSQRSNGIYTFSQSTESRVKRWYENKQYDDVAAFWERSYKDVTLTDLDPSLELNSLIRQLNWSAASLMRTGQRKEAATLIDSAVSLGERSLRDRPWDWYTKDAFSGLCFNAADAWIEVGEPATAQPLLRRGWGISLRQFGRESLLEKYADLPQKGKSPVSTTDEDRSFFEQFGPQRDKSKSGIKRFTIPCDFAGKKYPFHVYVLTGPRGYAELQDQFRWLKEFRGGEVPTDVRESFLRLNVIASENKVDFMELCVYALGTASKPPQEKHDDAEKKITERKAIYAKDFSSKNGKLLVEGYAEKAEALIELKRYLDAMTEFRNGIAVCEEVTKRGMGADWAGKESERLQGRVSFAKAYNIATGDMATILSSDADVRPVLLQIRASEFAKDGKVAEVKDAADRLRQHSPKSKNAKYNAACAYSLCVSILTKEKSGTGSTHDKQILELRQSAIQCLKEAIELGYSNFEQIGKDSDLDAVREMDEFKTLLPKR